jgi:iron(III) transport system ATP-binding protein
MVSGQWSAVRAKAKPINAMSEAPLTTQSSLPTSKHCSVRIHEVVKRYGETTAVDRVSLNIAGGELFFLLGPSGCGKTTLLRMLAGFVAPDAGDIFFGEQRITALPPRSRDAGLVFQTYALWPHMTVAENVAYGLRVRRLPRAEIAERVEKALTMVRLEGMEERRPNQLSGGQQQRVALARALVIEPRVLLLDEPLSNLDARLRDEMRDEIRRLHQETGLTMIYVTHDQKEALTLADRVAVMDHGTLVQVGRPRDIYERPATRFVANFLGDSNFIPGTLHKMEGTSCEVETALGTLRGLAGSEKLSVAAAVTCSIRPHAWTLDAPADTPNRIEGRVERLTFLGEIVQLRVLAGQTPIDVVCLPHVGGRLTPGATLSMSVPPEQVVVLAE